MVFPSRRIGRDPDAIAPDGSEVRVLCGTARGGMAVFSLPPGMVARAVVHRTVDEVWHVLAGAGRIWRRLGDAEEVLDLTAGVSLAIPVGMAFQFRCDGDAPLVVVAATMPPWPGEDEAVFVAGAWTPTV
jgi:mannose-6-phosphate isomerase-like protein (cupin superfamily)